VFENRKLKKIFGPKGEEVIGEWRRLHNEELCDLYCSPNIRVIESRKIRWAGHVARWKKVDMNSGSWWRNLREKVHLEDLVEYGKMILKLIFKKWHGEDRLDSCG
jgi:uncharacterized protein YcaQ